MERAASLLPEEQDWIADQIIALLNADADSKWDETFAKDPEKFDRLAQNALAEIRAGRTSRLDPDKL